MITANLNEVDKDFIESNNGEILKIYIDELDFYFKLYLKTGSRKLVVFSNGALDITKKQPPVFMRSSWHEEIQANCLFIDDRTIHNNNLKIGWGIGSKERHYLKDYNKFVNHICTLLDIEKSSLIYYGSSAGGFMSIAMASANRGAKAIVNNPQTYVSRYHEAIVKKLYQQIFPDKSKKEIIAEYSDRLSLVNIMARNKNVPEIFYLQNRLCQSDMDNHLTPLWKNMDRYKLNSRKINFTLYNNRRAGHNPIGKEQTINYINTVVNNEIKNLF
ncbi:glycosyl transferase [Corticicoccus populi]|uniref:Glycosyl transferase n=1 Tax=Corticicoccus populi TaxID=1812821 RepID=A0ABW5WVW1_9STAP